MVCCMSKFSITFVKCANIMRLQHATRPSTKREGRAPRARSQPRRGARRSGEGARRCTLFRGPPAGGRIHTAAAASLSAVSAARHPHWLETMAGGGPRRTVDGGGPRPCAPSYLWLEGLAQLHAHQRVMRMPWRKSRRRRTETVERERRRCGRKKGVLSMTFPRAATHTLLRPTPRLLKWTGSAADGRYEGAAEGGSGCDSAVEGTNATMDDSPARMRRPAGGALSAFGWVATAAAAAGGAPPQLAASTTLIAMIELVSVAIYGRHRRRSFSLAATDATSSAAAAIVLEGGESGRWRERGAFCSLGRRWGDRPAWTKRTRPGSHAVCGSALPSSLTAFTAAAVCARPHCYSTASGGTSGA